MIFRVSCPTNIAMEDSDEAARCVGFLEFEIIYKHVKEWAGSTYTWQQFVHAADLVGLYR